MAWMPGVGGGAAVADVLAGVFNPGGKLPITHPRSAGQIPVYFGHKASGGRSHWKGDYVDGPSDPLYPFGHGLSYTTFELSHPVVGPSEVGLNGSIAVQVDVANTGDTDGEEVVQLYTRDPRASVTRPVLELKGFVRVEVPTGGSRRVVFGLPVGQIGFHDRDLNHVVEPGAIEIYLGTSSRTLQDAGTVTVVDDGSGGPIKSFGGTVEVT
jgi:beta-glucosidase